MVDVKGKEIEKDLLELAALGTKEGMLWSAVYTEEEKKSKSYLANLMKKKGLEVYEDSVGNLFGTVPAKSNDDDKIILVGSHIDSVRNGGMYDGMLGVVSAIHAVSELYRKYGASKKRIEVVGLIEEEGSRFYSGYYGSKCITGAIKEKELNFKDKDGVSFVEAMRQYGYIPGEINKAKRDDIEAYYELHIEQGPVLDARELKIGTVEAIAGVNVLNVKIFGSQDHAGTTPMDMRKDSLVAAAKIISKIQEIPKQISDTATATVGCIQVSPGSSNVVTDLAEFSIDVRDLKKENIEKMFQLIYDEIHKLDEGEIEYSIECISKDSPVELDKQLLSEIEEIAKDSNIPSIRMVSGAGHDAQIFALQVPSALIFIPCKEGKSHMPEEYANPEDIKVGTELLARVLYKKAWL